MKNFMFPLVAVITLSACGPVMWEKPGLNQAQFSQDNARCQLVAKGMNSGEFYAQGKPGFVAGAALGNAIGTAVATRADYKNCMIAAGYTEESAQLQQASSKLKSTVDAYKSCASAAYSSHEIDSIRQHSPFNADQMTAGQLSDTALVSDPEVVALDFIHPKYQACQQTMLQAYSSMAPRLVPVWQASLAEGEGDMSALKARKMTWGEFNTRRRDRSTKLTAQIIATLNQGT